MKSQKSQGATKSQVQKTEKSQVQKPQVSESVYGPYFEALEHGLCRELAQKYHGLLQQKKKIQDSDGHVKHKIQLGRVYDAEMKFYHIHPDIVDPMTEVEMITFFNMVIRSTCNELTKTNQC